MEPTIIKFLVSAWFMILASPPSDTASVRPARFKPQLAGRSSGLRLNCWPFTSFSVWGPHIHWSWPIPTNPMDTPWKYFESSRMTWVLYCTCAHRAGGSRLTWYLTSKLLCSHFEPQQDRATMRSSHGWAHKLVWIWVSDFHTEITGNYIIMKIHPKNPWVLAHAHILTSASQPSDRCVTSKDYTKIHDRNGNPFGKWSNFGYSTPKRRNPRLVLLTLLTLAISLPAPSPRPHLPGPIQHSLSALRHRGRWLLSRCLATSNWIFVEGHNIEPALDWFAVCQPQSRDTPKA